MVFSGKVRTLGSLSGRPGGWKLAGQETNTGGSQIARARKPPYAGPGFNPESTGSQGRSASELLSWLQGWTGLGVEAWGGGRSKWQGRCRRQGLPQETLLSQRLRRQCLCLNSLSLLTYFIVCYRVGKRSEEKELLVSAGDSVWQERSLFVIAARRPVGLAGAWA